jgi:hypothetical protein
MGFTFQTNYPPSWSEAPIEALKDVDDDALLAELVRRRSVERGIALSISNGEELFTEDEAEDIPFYDDPRRELDGRELEEARAELMSGRRGEALIHLERALGSDFIGRLAVA